MKSIHIDSILHHNKSFSLAVSLFLIFSRPASVLRVCCNKTNKTVYCSNQANKISSHLNLLKQFNFFYKLMKFSLRTAKYIAYVKEIQAVQTLRLNIGLIDIMRITVLSCKWSL